MMIFGPLISTNMVGSSVVRVLAINAGDSGLTPRQPGVSYFSRHPVDPDILPHLRLAFLAIKGSMSTFRPYLDDKKLRKYPFRVISRPQTVIVTLSLP